MRSDSTPFKLKFCISVKRGSLLHSVLQRPPLIGDQLQIFGIDIMSPHPSLQTMKQQNTHRPRQRHHKLNQLNRTSRKLLMKILSTLRQVFIWLDRKIRANLIYTHDGQVQVFRRIFNNMKLLLPSALWKTKNLL